MDKCREDLEAKFANSPELKEGHITWWEESHSYVAKTEDYQESADYWNQILNAWQLRQPDIDLLEAKVEALQKQLIDQGQRFNEQAQRVKDLEFKNGELQKRVDAATKQAQNALQYVEEDMRGNHEFLQMAMIRTFKDLEQALKGEGNA